MNQIKQYLLKNGRKMILFALLLYMIVNPSMTLNGASRGLQLWFHTVLPSILPGVILSTLIIQCFGHTFQRPWLYVLFSGLLCGYPLGACACAQLYGRNREDAAKTQFLLALCNQSSPLFITGFAIIQTMRMQQNMAVILMMVYLPLLLLLLLEFLRNKTFYSMKIHSQPAAKITLMKLDEAIMHGFEVVTKLGGYIIIFSIGSIYIQSCFSQNLWLQMSLSGILEITNGIALCAANLGSTAGFDSSMMVVFCVSILAFGGLSCAAQTKSVLQNTFYSIKKYIYHKLLITVCTAIMAMIMIYVLKLL